MNPLTLNLLSAGAAQGLVKALEADFKALTGANIQARFGAVGAMREAFFAGEPCDVLVLTEAMIQNLHEQGHVQGAGSAQLGRVRTGVAVRAGHPHPQVNTAQGLRAALLAADSVYFPDPEKATAGIHFAKVMRELGVYEQLAPRLKPFPNGATAMREMAASQTPAPIGCTQVTEIRYTPGVELVGVLPQEFELATLYTAAPIAKSAQATLAAQFIELIAGPKALALRSAGGFEA